MATSPMWKGVFAGDSLEEAILDAEKSFSQHVEVLTDMGVMSLHLAITVVFTPMSD